jgi:hypothetical protein
MTINNPPEQQEKQAQSPLILRFLRIIEAFSKANEERDFYLDRQEGFLVYADLDKTEEELLTLFKELEKNSERYIPIPKMTMYESKKIMENFVHDKVYDIDTKDKLLDIISNVDARENFLEFLYDHMHDFEKWQQYYQERFRIQIIEWLRSYHLHFVFEEDLELPTPTIENLRRHMFEKKVSKDLEVGRKMLEIKAKTYYSSEALNPRPKRGRPPKQQAKVEVEPTLSIDIYATALSGIRPFLFTPDINSYLDISFSAVFSEEKQSATAKKRTNPEGETLAQLNQKLEELREMSKSWVIESKIDTNVRAHEIGKNERKRLRRKVTETDESEPKKTPKKRLQRVSEDEETQTEGAKKPSAKRRLKRSS